MFSDSQYNHHRSSTRIEEPIKAYEHQLRWTEKFIYFVRKKTAHVKILLIVRPVVVVQSLKRMTH